jgi:translation initiation factor 1
MTRLFAGTPFDIPPTCDDCGKPESDCTCTAKQKADAAAKRDRDAARLPPGEQTAIVTTEKRKGGRVVTVIEGLAAVANDLPSVLSQLQSACGAGGTVKTKDDRIELQGDHVAATIEKLNAIGYRVRR